MNRIIQTLLSLLLFQTLLFSSPIKLTMQNADYNRIQQIEIAEDNRIFTAVSKNNVVSIWDISNKTLIDQFQVSQPILNTTLSKQAWYLAIAFPKGVLIWDIRESKIKHRFLSAYDAEDKGPKLKKWREELSVLQKEEPSKRPEINEIRKSLIAELTKKIQDAERGGNSRIIAFSRDANYLLFSSLDLSYWYIFDNRTGEQITGGDFEKINSILSNYPIARLFLNKEEIKDQASFVKELKSLAPKLKEEEVNDTLNKLGDKKLIEHNINKTAIKISKDEQIVVSGDTDGNLVIFYPKNNSFQLIEPYRNFLRFSSLSPNGNYLAAVYEGRQGKKLVIWDLVKGEANLNYSIDSNVTGIAVGNEGKQIYLSTDSKIFNLDKKEINLDASNAVRIVGILPMDKGFLAFYNEDAKGTISQYSLKGEKVWNLPTEAILHYSVNKDQIAFLSSGKINYLDANKRQVKSLNASTEEATSVSISEDGKKVGVGKKNGSIEVFSLDKETGHKLSFEESKRMILLEGVFNVNKFLNLSEITRNLYLYSEDTFLENGDKQPVFSSYTKRHSGQVQSMLFSPDGERLYSFATKNPNLSSDRTGIVWNLDRKEKEDTIADTPNDPLTAFRKNKNELVVVSKSGLAFIWNELERKKTLSFAYSGGDRTIFIDENFFYKSTGKSDREAITFTYLGRSYSFDQFDLIFNQPAEVLSSINRSNASEDKGSLAIITRYKKYADYRAKLNGFDKSTANLTHFPRVRFPNRKNVDQVSENIFSFPISIADLQTSNLNIIGYKVYINGVPLYGDYIKKTYPGTDKTIKEKEVSLTEKVELAQGDNKIEVSAFTEDGVESPRESFTVKYEPPVKRKPDLYFVGIGVDEYNPAVSGGLDSLTYAVKDSKELEDTFKKSGKTSFGNVFTKVITNKEVNQTSIRALREFLGKSKVDDHVILFLSGHGIRKDTKISDLLVAFGDKIPEQYKLRDKGDLDDIYYYMTSEANVDKPWEKGIPLDGIRDLVNGIPSRQKIMLVDTCQSGEKLDLDDQTVASLTKNIEIRKTRGQTAKTRGLTMTTKPGASNEKKEDTEKKIIQSIAKTNALKEMSDLFPELRRGTGTIEISAATGAQSALESKEWQNGAFTFVIKEAIIKGKAKDKNGNITAQSLRRYVLDEVEKLTDGQQTPMVARDIAGRDFVIFGK